MKKTVWCLIFWSQDHNHYPGNAVLVKVSIGVFRYVSENEYVKTSVGSHNVPTKNRIYQNFSYHMAKSGYKFRDNVGISIIFHFQYNTVRKKKGPTGEKTFDFYKPEPETWYVPFTQFSIFALSLQSLYLHYLQYVRKGCFENGTRALSDASQ